MKQLFFSFIPALLFSSITCFSQPCTNLVFNQVLMQPTPALGVYVTYTVPAGKVWKIEGIMICEDTHTCGGGGAGQVSWNISRINGVRVRGNTTGNTQLITTLGCGSVYGSGFPKWMGAGHSIELYTEDLACSSTYGTNYLSIIEFNCTP